MSAEQVPPLTDRRLRFTDLCQDTTGVGEIEWRTFRDLLVRPRAVLEAYLVHGPTAGHRYSRPFGFYMALCGVLMFYMFLTGGMTDLIAQQPVGRLEPFIERSGKTRDAFIDDAEEWLTLVVTPLLAIFYALSVAPFLKWWSGLDWRRTLRSSWVLMCAWTVPILFLGPLPRLEGFELPGYVLMQLAFVVAFLRMGRGLWFDRWAGGILKSLLLLVLLFVGAFVGMIPSFNIGLWGATLSS